MPPNRPKVVAVAILEQQGKFLLQLRDDIPTIIFPGYWALFGGHLEEGETPEMALKREIKEEINYIIREYQKIGCYQDERVIRHVFYAPLNAKSEDLILGEGWDFSLVSPEIIKKGSHYSERAKQVKAITPIHQQILLDYIYYDSNFFHDSYF